ncbi:NADH dehydrogenase [Folsomia candida]|uniref:NADH dehydrogenase n=1 Tax=Folsomia candida TaxID=158441 RepID=A0A226E0C8_FOLCA|nr:NADH dehydrogenase [Folsomia candida]
MKRAHKLLVVGGGAGGLELVAHLGLAKHSNVEMTLLDGRPTHIWKPLLHEVATGSFNSGQDELNYFSHSAENNYKFLLGWMGGLDRKNKIVKVDALKVGGKLLCGPRDLHYDTLVMAIGSVPDTFGTPGATKHCLFLNSPHDADELRLKMLIQGLSIIYGASEVPKLRIGIVGAGATGIELAAEIHHTIESLAMTGFKLDNLETTIIEASPRILSMADEKLAQFAKESLEKKNIQILTDTKITGVTDKGFILGNGTFLKKELRVWTAGVRSPRWLTKTGLSTNHQSRILTNDYLQSVDDPDVFAIGDCSATHVQPGMQGHIKILPTTAQVAHQQSVWLRHYLKKRIIDGDTSGAAPFEFRSQGFLVSLGHRTAVGSLAIIRGMKDYQVKGHLAKGLYVTLYRKHQAAIFGVPKMCSLLIGDQFHYMAMPELKFH